MRFVGSLLVFASCLLIGSSAFAEKVKIGGYSGRPGHYVLVGLDFGTRLDLIATNLEASRAMRKALDKVALGETKGCDVEGELAQIGTQAFYVLYKVLSCK